MKLRWSLYIYPTYMHICRQLVGLAMSCLKVKRKGQIFKNCLKTKRVSQQDNLATNCLKVERARQ